ncbi:carbohydrate ABC transporter permease, partial [uncultured Anaerotruncus sp.]
GLSLSIESSFVPLFKLFQSIHLYNTQFGVILLYIAFRIPLTVFLMRSYFISFPKDIEEAARMDGCSSFAIYWRMILPIGKPILASSALMNLIFTWNEFLTALIFLEDQDLMTIPVGLNALKGEMLQEWNIQLAAVVIASIPLIIMFLCMQKQFVKGLTAGSVKG